MKLSYLTQKKGPLPIWAWSLITAIGLYLLYRMYKSKSSSSANATPDTSATGATTDPYAYGGSGGGGDPFAPIDGSATTTPVTEGPGNPAPDGGNNAPSPTPTTTPSTDPPATTPAGASPVAPINPALTIGGGLDPAIATRVAAIAATPVKVVTAKTLPTVTDLESKTGKKLVTGPTAIKSVTNKTGVSANKGQGVISIH